MSASDITSWEAGAEAVTASPLAACGSATGAGSGFRGLTVVACAPGPAPSHVGEGAGGRTSVMMTSEGAMAVASTAMALAGWAGVPWRPVGAVGSDGSEAG